MTRIAKAWFKSLPDSEKRRLYEFESENYHPRRDRPWLDVINIVPITYVRNTILIITPVNIAGREYFGGIALSPELIGFICGYALAIGEIFVTLWLNKFLRGEYPWPSRIGGSIGPIEDVAYSERRYSSGARSLGIGGYSDERYHQIPSDFDSSNKRRDSSPRKILRCWM